VKHFGREKMMTEPLSKDFLWACSTLLESSGYPQSTENAMRLLIRELREPRPAPRPFREPDPAACDVDPDDYM
jgi:hypothetical protein